MENNPADVRNDASNGEMRIIEDGGRSIGGTPVPDTPPTHEKPRCSAYDENNGVGPDALPDGTPDAPPENQPAGDPDGVPGGPGPVRPPMTGAGKLIFQVTTAGGAIPLEGAVVSVMDSVPDAIPDLSGEPRIVMYTGDDGKTRPLTLPAPARTQSQEAQSPSEPLPYALYNATVELDGYYPQGFSLIPVFDGITSIQRLDLIPLPLDSFPGTPPNPIREGVNPDL